MRVTRDNTIAMVVDVQQRLHPHMHDADALTTKLVRLIRGLRILEVPIVATEQYPRGLGRTIEPVADALADAEGAASTHPEQQPRAPIEKTAFSCWDEPAVVERVGALGAGTLLIAGIEAHVCVLQTTLDVIAAGYEPVVVLDATSSRSPRDLEIAARRIEREGGRITSVESVLFEMQRESGTARFKEISRLVK